MLQYLSPPAKKQAWEYSEHIYCTAVQAVPPLGKRTVIFRQLQGQEYDTRLVSLTAVQSLT